MTMINISAYRFVSLDETAIPALRAVIKDKAQSLSLKGTVLLSAADGINLFLSGEAQDIQAFKDFLDTYDEFKGLHYKDSPSQEQPFTRLLVKIKQETIAFGEDSVVPQDKRAPYVTPKELKAWYDNQEDMLILDTRNDYEVALGTFDQAVELDIKNFRAFPNALAQLPKEYKQKKIVTFCTGGIRCEKAAEYMLQQGFEEVYQLDGGILNYFEQCGAKHYEGECFVFDKRVAVDPSLNETATRQCYACRMPLMLEQQQGLERCPHCDGSPTEGKREQAVALQAKYSSVSAISNKSVSA